MEMNLHSEAFTGLLIGGPSLSAAIYLIWVDGPLATFQFFFIQWLTCLLQISSLTARQITDTSASPRFQAMNGLEDVCQRHTLLRFPTS